MFLALDHSKKHRLELCKRKVDYMESMRVDLAAESNKELEMLQTLSLKESTGSNKRSCEVAELESWPDAGQKSRLRQDDDPAIPQSQGQIDGNISLSVKRPS